MVLTVGHAEETVRKVTIPVWMKKGAIYTPDIIPWPEEMRAGAFGQETVTDITAAGDTHRRYMRDDGSIIDGGPLVIHHG